MYETKERGIVYQTIVTKVIVRSLETPRRVLVMSFVDSQSGMIKIRSGVANERQFNGVVSVSIHM